MTHPTDEELAALVKRLTWHREHPVTGKLVYANEDGPDAAAAIAALRAQLAEARTELVRRVDMHECAMAERDDATLYSDEQKARADRAEAALAALIEAAIREIWGLCEDLEDEAHAKLKLKLTEHEQGFWAAQKMTAKRIRRATQMPTNDRTALDRLLADAEAKALRMAAKKAASFLVGDPLNGTPLRNPMAHEIAAAILNMIPKEGEA